jgi:hypothetical protein
VEQPDVEEMVTEVIRPAAIIPEAAARAILTGMAVSSVYTDGLWLAEPSRWIRYDQPWTHPLDQITIFQVAVTQAGRAAGFTPLSLAEEALQFGGLTLAACPRAQLEPPPKPFRF